MYYIFCLILLIGLSSCNQNNKSNFSNGTIIHDTILDEKSANKVDSISLDDLVKLLENKKVMTETDFKSLFFHLKSNDESISESLGYLIFEYYYKDKSNNTELKKYLNKLDIKQQNKSFEILINVMCLEISLNNYTNFESFIKDFPVIPSNESNKKIFNECLSNRVDN
jgi:hypothetical protein